MDDIKTITKEILKTLNESYVFPKNISEDEVPSELKDTDSELPFNEKEVDDVKPSGSNDFDNKIKEMRKSSMIMLAELDPTSEESKYKLMKSIYEACDKFLYSNKSEEKISVPQQ